MLLLIDGNAPPCSKWKDHALKAEWSRHRECQIGGDFLLIYLLDDTA